MTIMIRSLVTIVWSLTACARTQSVAANPESSACPGTYTIVRGACDHVAATSCHGVCGYIVRRDTCLPVTDAVVIADSPASTSAATDSTGRFDLSGIRSGHRQLRVLAEQEDARAEIDVTGATQPLEFPLELTFLPRSCDCGGACPN